MSASTKWNPNLEVSRWSGDKKKRKKKYFTGGKAVGASHKNGGIDINVEGGEFVLSADSVAYIEENMGKNFLPNLNKLSKKRARTSSTKKSKKTFKNYGMGE